MTRHTHTLLLSHISACETTMRYANSLADVALTEGGLKDRRLAEASQLHDHYRAELERLLRLMVELQGRPRRRQRK